MESRVKEFKDFHKITGDINQQFKDDNGLFVKHKDEWVRLTKNNGSFYAKATLKIHGSDFMRAVGLMPPKPPKPTPQYQTPTMNDLRNEMAAEYAQPQSLEFEQTPFTIGNFLKGYVMNVPLGHATEKDPKLFLEEIKPKIQHVLVEELKSLGGLKFQLGLKVLMHKEQNSGEPVSASPTFYHEQFPITNENEIDFESPFQTT